MQAVAEKTRPPLLALALFTMGVLALEVFLTRLLAYTVDTFLIYLVLGIAMTGFGAAGSLVALRQGWLSAERVPAAIAWWAAGYPASIVFCYASFVRVAPGLPLGVGWVTFLVAGLLTIPFAFAGAVITLALSSAGASLGRVYAADLVGSGLGCFLPLFLLGPLDGSRFLAFVAVLGAIAALLFVRRAPPDRALRGLAWASLALALIAFSLAPRAFPTRPENLGQVAIIERYAQAKGFRVDKIFDRWNMTGRVEVYRFRDVPGAPEPYPFHFYAQDNTAGAIMARWDGRNASDDPPGRIGSSEVASLCSDTLFGQAYFAPRRRVLVIGVGGGADVQCALYERATQVDAVEINPDSVGIIRGPFNEFLGGIGSRPNVRYHVRDGRSFARAAKRESFDLVQLSGVDTKHILASGALPLSENHLYTREAFVDYLESLSPSGVLSIIRFGEPEAIRLANTATTALRELGAASPQNHIVMARNGLAYGVIVKKTEYTADELNAFHERFWFAHRDFRGFRAVFLEPFGYVPQQRPELVYRPGDAANETHPAVSTFFAHAAANATARFEAAYPFDVSPTRDDRPFFFDVTRYDRPESASLPHLRVLQQMIGSVLALALGAILLPLVSLRSGLRRFALLLAPLYFGGVGLGYLFIEIWLIHRFAMFLGHQSYALSAVLATLLVATGAGALLAPRWLPVPRHRAALGVVAVFCLIGLGALALPSIVDALWQANLAVRIVVAAAFVAPLGFAMGFPFPAGLDWFAENAPRGVPWGVGINFFASVVATVAAIPLALFFGYVTVLLFGVAAYLLALIGSAGFR